MVNGKRLFVHDTAMKNRSSGIGQRPPYMILALVHGLYNVAGGLWPLLHMESFEIVTGPKRDEWLVRTVGAILLFVGLLLLHDAIIRRRIDRTLRLVAGGVAGVLGTVALVSSLTGIISVVYLFDGLAHCGFFSAWLIAHWRQARSGRA